ncbi:MAG: hypothetical protein IPN51_06240 [Chloracidobacterium sp.]|nr:hypothetical protein [Chloracidobacterium sp.]
MPQFTITAQLLSLSEKVAQLRERIQSAAVELSWIPALQKDTRVRNVHASTAIEGNPLTLEQVRALEEGRTLTAPGDRSQREVLNYFAGLRYVELSARKNAFITSTFLPCTEYLPTVLWTRAKPDGTAVSLFGSAITSLRRLRMFRA